MVGGGLSRTTKVEVIVTEPVSSVASSSIEGLVLASPELGVPESVRVSPSSESQVGPDKS